MRTVTIARQDPKILGYNAAKKSKRFRAAIYRLPAEATMSAAGSTMTLRWPIGGMIWPAVAQKARNNHSIYPDRDIYITLPSRANTEE